MIGRAFYTLTAYLETEGDLLSLRTLLPLETIIVVGDCCRRLVKPSLFETSSAQPPSCDGL